MTLPRAVADVLADYVVFEVECIDRMYCNVYAPQLQFAAGLLGYGITQGYGHAQIVAATTDKTWCTGSRVERRGGPSSCPESRGRRHLDGSQRCA